ncbi:MAG: plasmid pRiA4b ORF-3 family protein [Candidatus Vogelbacteria bacterium]|nr:plasmid pRiA4b ORF-3 family protein [Candidatus Vogelbacteria bacterium]
MDEKKDQVFQLKITLDNSTPRIWRRLLISKNASFFDLHVAIQDVMGWFDSHLHGFSISSKDRNIAPTVIQFPNPELDDDFAMRDVRDERLEKILNYFDVSIRQCKYEYDFGDGWVHTILFEKELPLELGIKYPKCLAGKNACPPEDCGGVWGYEEKLEIIKNPEHSEYEDIIEWLGVDDPSEFDPTKFDIRDIEFRDAKKVLREHEKGFGVSPNNPK